MKNSGSVAASAAADRRSLHCLALAAIIGIGLGCLTVAGWVGVDQLPGTVIARVSDTDIRLVDYQRALRLFASEKRDPITDHDRSLVLERMVEEELLIQHGVAAGLVRGDRRVRTTVIQSILTGLMVELDAEAKEAVGNNDSPETGNAGATADATAHNTLLREYLGQLRDAASIRWVDGGSAR